MRCVLLHYHIFKNAGSTIEEIFERSFGKAFSRIETPDREGLVSNQNVLDFLNQNPCTKAISSHQIRYPTPKFPGFLFLDVILLRDPIDRIRSIYDFYHPRPATGDPLSELAQGSLGDFVAGLVGQQPLYTRNVQVNQLACAGDSDEPAERDFHVAAKRLRDAAFLGVVDCFNKSMVAGEHRLLPVFPELDCAQPAENVTGGMDGDLARRVERVRAACDESVYAELLRLNALDIRLVNCARAEVERRFRLVPDGCAKLDEFAHRISEPPGRRLGPGARRNQQHRSFATRLQARQTSTKARPNWLARLRRLAAAPLDAFTLWLSTRRYGTNLFDAEYYRATYPEIGSDTNPLAHFLSQGAFEGKKPHPLFDPKFYRQKYPDVVSTNPLAHYLRHAIAQRRQATPFFDSEYYLAHNPDVRRSRIPPLLHYVRHGAAEGRKPHPLFQPEYYARCGFGVELDAGQLLAHFAESGADAFNPHPLFDCDSYLKAYPEAAAQDRNPLAHYLLSKRDKPKFEASKGLEVAQFEIADVPVAIIFRCGADSQSAAPRLVSALVRLPHNGTSVVLVSKDSSGTVTIEAEPQQQPFFEAIPVEQLYAQINACLTVD